MTAPTDSGPFRRDARIERTAETAPMTTAWAVLRALHRPGLEVPGYAAVLGAGMLAVGAAVDPHPWSAFVSGAVMLGVAAWLWRRFRDARVTAEREQRTENRRVSFTASSILLDGTYGRSAWSYAAMRRIVRRDPWLVVELPEGQALVLRDDGQLGAWLAARATALTSQPPRGRTLLLLAVLYVLIVAAVVVVLPGIVSP